MAFKFNYVSFVYFYFPLYYSRKLLVTQSCLTLQPYGLRPTKLLGPWDSPGKNTEVGSHSLLQGIFLTQGKGQEITLGGGLL